MPDEPSVAGRHETAQAPAPRFTGLEGGGDCPGCVALREQNRFLCDLLVQESDALHAVKDYAEEMGKRAGAQVDAATVAASLYPLIAGFPLPVKPCRTCVARREADLRQAEMLLGLAGLQKAAGA